MITTLHLYEEKRDKYLISRCVARLPAIIKESLNGKNGWENRTTHPTIYDDKLDAIIIFNSDKAKVDYERKSSPEYRNETEEIKKTQAMLKTTLANMQKELALMKEGQNSNKSKKKD